MKKARELLYKIYKQNLNNQIINTIINYLFIRVFQPIKHIISKKYVCSNIKNSPIKIAIICDEMTWRNLEKEISIVYITPWNYKKVFTKYKPDIFICESAWSGIEELHECWRGRIYKNSSVKFDNRRELYKILEYCDKENIKTIFWNKEDPTFFDDAQYDFVSTALDFSVIFTTSEECIDMYKDKGHSNVKLLTFSASTKLYYRKLEICKKNQAVFAGSWYLEQKKRCIDMEKIFDMVLNKGIELIIYDRQSNSGNMNNLYPLKYHKYIKPAVPFGELNDIYNESKYIININTVMDSKTMFARRVFEAMLCDCIVISNESSGLKSIFSNNIWFADSIFDIENIDKAIKINKEIVEKNYTVKKMIEMIIKSQKN